MSTELKTLSRANSEIEEPTPDQHLMAIVAGSLQRIADALEQSSAKPQADELAELRCQVKGMGQMVDLHAGSVPRIDREHMALRIEHQRLFKRVERIESHLAGPMATWDAQGIIQSPDSPEVPDRLGGAEGEPEPPQAGTQGLVGNQDDLLLIFNQSGRLATNIADRLKKIELGYKEHIVTRCHRCMAPTATRGDFGSFECSDCRRVRERLRGTQVTPQPAQGLGQDEPDGVSGPSRADQAGSPGRKSTLSE